MKASDRRRSPSLQDLHELIEELSLALAAVQSTALAEHIVESIAHLEILAACDDPSRDARHDYQVGRALVTSCERLLGIAPAGAEKHASA